jgi:trans-2-enoyl-CoA reductase
MKSRIASITSKHRRKNMTNEMENIDAKTMVRLEALTRLLQNSTPHEINALIEKIGPENFKELVDELERRQKMIN